MATPADCHPRKPGLGKTGGQLWVAQKAKHVSTLLALNTTRYLAKETAYLPWNAAVSNLGYFQLMFDRSEVYGPMRKYLEKQVTPLFHYFKDLTSNWTTIPDSLMDQIPPNLRSSIYCSAIKTGGEEAWDFGWEMFRNATVVSEADKLRSALACSKEPWILQRYLRYTLDPTKIRRQDATSTINSIASNVIGQSLVWDFVRANWKTLFSQYGGGSFSFSNLIRGVTQRFASEYELKQLAGRSSARPAPDSPPAMAGSSFFPVPLATSALQPPSCWPGPLQPEAREGSWGWPLGQNSGSNSGSSPASSPDSCGGGGGGGGDGGFSPSERPWRAGLGRRQSGRPRLGHGQRQSASQREKLRMRRLAQALHALRRYLPDGVVPAGQNLTKIETLRLAIRYIAHLSELLGLSEEELARRGAARAPPGCPLCPTGEARMLSRRERRATAAAGPIALAFPGTADGSLLVARQQPGRSAKSLLLRIFPAARISCPSRRRLLGQVDSWSHQLRSRGEYQADPFGLANGGDARRDAPGGGVAGCSGAASPPP
ncbi:hypothetical protein JRQ81_006743, partial [Phrynocephalus forsythii]